MPSILNDVIMHGQDSAALEAAHTLVRTLTSEGEYASAMSTTEPLAEALEEMGFGGLWKTSFQEQVPYESKGCLELTEKLIEVYSVRI
jgi:neurofibromin 1